MFRQIIHNSFLLMTLCFWVPLASAAETETDYMAIMMQGQKIGHATHTRSLEGSHVITTEEFSMTLGRGGQAVTVSSREMYIETSDGKPLSFEMSMKASGVEQKTSGTIQDGKILLSRQVMGTTQNSVVDWPAEARMPEGMQLVQKQKGLAPGTQYELTTFRPDMLMSIQTKVLVGDKQKVDLLGRVPELTEVKQISRVQGQEITVTSYVDDNFKTLKSIAPMMGMTLEFVVCDKDFALQKDNVIDFLEKLSIPSPVQLINLNTVESIVYEIKPTTEQTLMLPSSSHQIVQPGDGSLLVTVQRLIPAENVTFPYEGKDPNILDALKPTEILQSDNKEIIDLARHAVGGTTDTAKAVKQIESFVAGYIQKKDLSVGYASAAEVAQSRQGDCSEHAVLTAAMCRAVGIPARIVCGVLYVDSFVNRKSIFGGHMWVEAYIGNQWIGVDATPVNQTNAGLGFGPGHIALAHGDGSPKDFFNLVNTLGCFKIEKLTVHKANNPKEDKPQTP
ncbi:MAG: transglutaminase domain-containing protein [Phycisphaerae bacterium]|nr:transglutaminase domain-containing protein [Phycisphaerae bacterium]